jgi:hypothetical protein
MKRKLSLLCGAAVLGVAGSLALTTAGFAQTTTDDKDSGRYYDTNPTPQEQAQTNTLNTTQAQDDGTVQSTTSAPEPGTTADAQYQAQQQQYQQQQQQYQDQKDHYHTQLMHYEYDRTHPRDWWSTSYDRATLDDFYHVDRGDLIGREVDERDGLMIGEVRDIERAPDGRVARVEIALHDNRSAWIHADNLRYDAIDHTFFTDVPADTLYDHSHESGS